MLTGLDILIARMGEHPEEFRHNGRWTDLLVAVDKHLTEEERQALKQGYTDMARDAFNEAVLKTIANEEIHWDDVSSINIDYDSVMAYPLQKAKIEGESQKQQMARQVEMMKMEMAARQQSDYNNYAARQSSLAQSGLFNR